MPVPVSGSVETAPRPGAGSSVTMLRSLASDRVSRISFAVVAVLVGTGYSVLLPFEFTQRISWRNWHYLDARSVAFSVALGLATAWIVAVQVFATRRVIRVRGSGIAGAGTVLGLLPSLLCCTPIVPTLLSVVGLSGAGLAGTSSRTQAFLAANQDAILIVSLALVLATAIWATRCLLRAACLTSDGCAVTGKNAHADITPIHAGRQAADPATKEAGSTHG
jgi:hypothetical protein